MQKIEFDSGGPLVTVCCMAFNHERYIAQALDSFLSQQAPFAFEIVVQDDCSTDATAELIRNYSSKFPKIVKPIFQDDNQWSKGTFPSFYFPLRAARGKYIAFCDGDDYWSSPEKLDKQVLAMNEFGVGMCGHPAEIISENGTRTGKYTGQRVLSPQRFEARTIIEQEGNALPLSSIMINGSVRADLLENCPPVRFHTGLQLMGARRDGFSVLPEALSVYREQVPNSATQLLLGTAEKRAETATKKIESLNRIMQLYGEDNHRGIRKIITKQIAVIFSVFGLSQAVAVVRQHLPGLPLAEKVDIGAEVVLSLSHSKLQSALFALRRLLAPLFRTVVSKP